MKKALAIGGAVLGALLAAALVIFVFFPGLPTYFKVRHRFEHTDENAYFMASIKCSDEETAKQMISSIELG